MAAAMKTLPSFGAKFNAVKATEPVTTAPASPNDSGATPSGLSPEETMLLSLYRATDPTKRMAAIEKLI